MNKLDILKNKRFNLQLRLRDLSSEMFSAMRDCRCDGDFNAILEAYQRNRDYLKQQLMEVEKEIKALLAPQFFKSAEEEIKIKPIKYSRLDDLW